MIVFSGVRGGIKTLILGQEASGVTEKNVPEEVEAIINSALYVLINVWRIFWYEQKKQPTVDKKAEREVKYKKHKCHKSRVAWKMWQQESEGRAEAAGRDGTKPPCQLPDVRAEPRTVISRARLAGFKRRGEKDRWLRVVTERCENYKASINSTQVNPSLLRLSFTNKSRTTNTQDTQTQAPFMSFCHVTVSVFTLGR